MAEYIEREALLKSLDMAMECKDCPRNVNRKTYYDRCACSEVGDICNIITDFPTATDVQPVKRGKWIFTEKLILGNPYGSYKCSECMYHVPHEDNYCPNCGADMREKEGE